jgi:hypothetical protein
MMVAVVAVVVVMMMRILKILKAHLPHRGGDGGPEEHRVEDRQHLPLQSRYKTVTKPLQSRYRPLQSRYKHTNRDRAVTEQSKWPGRAPRGRLQQRWTALSIIHAYIYIRRTTPAAMPPKPGTSPSQDLHKTFTKPRLNHRL